MKVSEFYKIADNVAPKALSDEYCRLFNAYDNSGILIDTGKEVKGTLFSLDLSMDAISEAEEKGANLIVTHHPAIYGKIGRLDVADLSVTKKLLACAEKGISVISMHLNLDCAKDGIDENLMLGICRSAGAGTRSSEEGSLEIMHKIGESGYGRAYNILPITLQKLKKNIEKEFSSTRVQTYGEGEKEIRRIASFCGAGADEEAVEFALREGADLIVSSDFKHHVLTFAREAGLAVLSLTHYASENYGFKKYYEKINQSAEIPCFWHEIKSML